ncbi:MAG: hypothetical protein J7K66_01590 [Anaerolineaceae bacterium]|nr:hypothetical protein [Anaerolineaceae bacterium]
MEEIICPQCGRPNLIEAKKCWYCQTILENKSEESYEKISSLPKNNSNKIENPQKEIQSDQNIPEWLKHIRELKEADQPPEEKDPNWQQQDLFASENKPDDKKTGKKRHFSSKEKPVRHNSKVKKKDDLLLRNEPKKPSVPINDHDTQKKHVINKPDKKSETLSDELPEGFTKL